MGVPVAAGFAAVVVILGAACGGTEGGDASGAKRSIEAEAQERAESIVLTLSDFPDGWRGVGPTAEEEAMAEDFRTCIGADYSAFTITGEASSDDFSMGESAEVSSEAQVFDNEGVAGDALEAFAKSMGAEAVADCMKEFIAESAEGEGLQTGDIELGELSFTPPADVDEARAWQMVIPVEVTSGEGEGLSATVYLDLVYLREGDVLASVQTSDVPSPFDSDLRDQLLEAVAGRMTE